MSNYVDYLSALTSMKQMLLTVAIMVNKQLPVLRLKCVSYHTLSGMLVLDYCYLH